MMANEDIGEVACAHCAAASPVRKNKNGKLYYACPACGLINPTTRAGQDWMLTHARLYGAEGKPEPVMEPVPVTEGTPAEIPTYTAPEAANSAPETPTYTKPAHVTDTPVTKKPGFWDRPLFGDDEVAA